MDTKELERFCPWAREELVGAVGRGMVQLGVDGAGRAQWPAGSEAVAHGPHELLARPRAEALQFLGVHDVLLSKPSPATFAVLELHIYRS